MVAASKVLKSDIDAEQKPEVAVSLPLEQLMQSESSVPLCSHTEVLFPTGDDNFHPVLPMQRGAMGARAKAEDGGIS
jgi:hypothetical protein